MTQRYIHLIGITLLMAGCATPDRVAKLDNNATDNGSTIQQAEYQDLVQDVDQPTSMEDEPESELLPIPQIENAAGDGLTLEALEQMALGGNPAVGQAAAQVRALRGKYVQVGLPPNPSVGYVASEVGNEGRAGQQGGFAGQDFITGGKLDKNRAIVAAEIDKAEQNLRAIRTRVLTDVRTSYYRALVAQQRVEWAGSLVKLTGEAVKASKDLLEADEIPQAGLLQTEVEQQAAEIILRNAENELSAAWHQLSAVLGDIELPPQELQGDAQLIPEALDWDATLARVTLESPEMAAAMAELSRSRRTLTRAYAEPIPDISTQLMVQYDNSTDDTIGGVQVGIPLPLWNKNQGGIRQAQSEITVASQNIDRVALDLKNRLATTFRDYSNARSQAELYSTKILPRAKQTFDLVRMGYSQGEAGYLDLLTAQRTYAQTNLAYLEALDALWQNHMKIDGLLLDNSLGSQSE
jgi:cobalt-zinc-cadmium efflux system outer membrane protein